MHIHFFFHHQYHAVSYSYLNFQSLSYMLVFFLRYGISSSDLSFLLLHLSKQFFIHSCYNISDSNSTKYSHLFPPMIFYVCCNFNKLFFESSMYVPCFFTLYLFIVIKVTKKWSQQQHKLTAIPMLIRGLSKMNWYKNPLIWYFLYSLFSFAYQMIGLYYSIFFLCYIY